MRKNEQATLSVVKLQEIITMVDEAEHALYHLYLTNGISVSKSIKI